MESKPLFSRKEAYCLLSLSAFGLISYLSGLDDYVAAVLGARTPSGISLFLSSTYYAIFLLTGLVLSTLRRRRAGMALLTSILIVFLIQVAFTDISPRARPPQAQHIGDNLMQWIQRSGTTSSFPSGHTGSSFAVFTTFMLLDMHPLIVLLLALPIAASRILLVQHYVSDVIGGAIVGYVASKAVYRIIAEKI
jgi:membrane-associated phospholipid phosphatase